MKIRAVLAICLWAAPGWGAVLYPWETVSCSVEARSWTEWPKQVPLRAVEESHVRVQGQNILLNAQSFNANYTAVALAPANSQGGNLNIQFGGGRSGQGRLTELCVDIQYLGPGETSTLSLACSGSANGFTQREFLKHLRMTARIQHPRLPQVGWVSVNCQ